MSAEHCPHLRKEPRAGSRVELPLTTHEVRPVNRANLIEHSLPCATREPHRDAKWERSDGGSQI